MASKEANLASSQLRLMTGKLECLEAVANLDQLLQVAAPLASVLNFDFDSKRSADLDSPTAANTYCHQNSGHLRTTAKKYCSPSN